MVLADAVTGTPAALASTGEQKALLVGVILRHAALIAEARGFAPMLLLDEPAVHLDPERRAALFAALVQLPAQTLITGTDAETFLPLAGRRRGAAGAWRRIAAGSAFSTDQIRPIPLCPERCSGYISRVSSQPSGVARRHVRRHRAAA